MSDVFDTNSQNIWRPSRRSIVTMAGLAPLLAAAPALAQQTDADATRILRSLAPHDRQGRVGNSGGGGGRAVVRRPPRPVLIEVTIRDGGVRRTITVDLSRRVEITVFFNVGSATLRTDAQITLTRLARVLRDPILVDQEFLIAGHTSSDGNYDDNVELSGLRALAVRDWLVELGDITPARLVANGFGPDMPRNRANTASAINRRVEVIAIV